jgi:hypothetical protein
MFGLRSSGLLSLQASLLFGIAWQIFTLTKAGAGLIGKINDGCGNYFKKERGYQHEEVQ